MKKLTINIDMDGVIYCMMDELASIARQENVRAFLKSEGYVLPDDLQGDVGVWEIWEAWGIPKKAFWKLFYLAIDEGVFINGQALPGAVDAITGFVKAGHRVRIVTSKNFSGRNAALKAQTDVLAWLHRNTPWSHKVEIVFAHNKQGYDADIVIDDKPTLKWAQDDAANVLFDRPWNRKIDAPGVGCYPLQTEHVYRAIGWEEVEYLVEKMSA